MILDHCEQAARAEGFAAVELMGTAGGVPLYTASGYEPIERADTHVDGVVVPLTRMWKPLRNMA